MNFVTLPHHSGNCGLVQTIGPKGFPQSSTRAVDF
jgi:hypothetical protein